MRVRIDETRHQRSAANIDNVRIFMVNACLRHRKYPVTLHQNVERLLQFRESVENKVCVREERLASISILIRRRFQDASLM